MHHPVPHPERKHLPHVAPPWVRAGEVYFITICVLERNGSPLTDPIAAQKLLAAARHYHLARRWWLRLFLIMPDHVHALLAFPANRRMKTTLAAWKSYAAKATGIAWQRDFFDHRPRNLHALEEKENYILDNPMRWGLAAQPDDWPWVLRQRDLPAWTPE
jgi:REP element-mobilizing transposase RayT